MSKITSTSCNAVYAYGTELQKSSFSSSVRAFHLGRLPKFNTAFSGSICAYCGEETGRRSMRIDHIIPMRTYIRYRMLNDPAVGTAVARDSDMQLSRIADDYYSDDSNLLLACQTCNSAKSEAMPDAWLPGSVESWLDRAQAYLTDAGKRKDLQTIENLCETIAGLPGQERNFVLFGAGVNTSRMDTRKRDRDTTPDKWIAIQRILINRLGTSRPSIGYATTHFEGSQAPATAGPARDLRVCLYCLGLFMDQAFQLDHVRPVNRSRVAEAVATERYNDPSNIIAVCGPCNGSKGNARLSGEWLNERERGRIEEGLPGLNTVLGKADLAKAKAKRDALLS